jgi:hypothetical protein
MVSRFLVLKRLTTCSPVFHYVSSEKMPDQSGRLFRFPAASCCSPGYRPGSGKYRVTNKKRLRDRQAPIVPSDNKPAHPHYCSGNPG